MYEARSYFWGGPLNGQRRVHWTPSSQRIPLASGTYEKRATRFSDVFLYVWREHGLASA
jgi:hypothetical protein